MSRKQPRRQPFTLLETVVAVAVFAVVGGLAAMVIYSLPQSWSLMQEQSSRLDGLVRTEQFMDRAVRNAVPMYWPEPFRGDRQLFMGRESGLVTAYRCRIDGETNPGLAFAAVGLRGDKLIVQYRNEPIVYWEEEEEDILPETLHEEVLLEGVAALRLRYAEWKNLRLQWLDSWDEERNYIPQAVALEVEFLDTTRVVFLRRTAGNSFYSSYGGRSESKP